MINIDYYSWLRTAKVLAEKNGLTIRFENKSQPRTDGHMIYVQRPSAMWTREQFVVWAGTLYHEIGHLRPETRDCFTAMEKHDLMYKPFENFCTNVLEDHRQEFLGHEEYEGRLNILGEMWRNLYGENLSEGKFAEDDKDKKRLAAEALYAWNVKAREVWMPHVTGIFEQFYEKLHPQSKAWVDQLLAGDYQDELQSGLDGEGVYLLGERIREEVFKLPPTSEEEVAKAKAASGKGNKGAKSEKEKGKGKGKPEDGEGEDQVAAETHYNDLLMHEHHQERPSYEPLKIHYDGAVDREAYVPKSVKMRNPDSAVAVVESWYQEGISRMAGGENIASTLRKLLQVRALSIYQHNIKVGKIHNRNVYKATMKDTGDYQSRIFKKKVTNNILDTVLYILVDQSGSMGGEKYKHAAKAACLLNDSISCLRIPFEITTFTDDGSPLHTIVKAFNENLTNEKLIERFSRSANYMGDNADGESILWAFSELRRRRETRKVLLVLSDGQPACSRGGIMTFTKEVIAEIQRSPVEIYGLGIMDDTVSRFYKEHKVIYSANELEEALLNVIRNKLLRS